MTSFERICAIVSSVTGIPTKTIARDCASSRFQMDSLDMAEVILEVEEQFDLIVEDEECINSIDDLVRCVEAQCA